MAKATQQAEVKPPVLLELTQDEAQTVMNLVGSIIGDPVNSQRKHTGAIYYALRDLGFKSDPTEMADGLKTISFMKWKEANHEEN